MSSREGLLRVGVVVDGRYQVLGHLGSGGHSVVYEARQVLTTQRVALKLLRKEAVRKSKDLEARFEREMQVVAQLGHPNIVRLLDAGRLPDGELYIALEFVEGETIAGLVQRAGGLEPLEARRLMLEVLDAIAFAHERGVVHRDLKPHNIMVAGPVARRHAKVLDFGIAALVGDARRLDDRDLTVAGEFNGTPAYMAPEQLIEGTPSIAGDVYAWGLTFLELLTGRAVMHEASVAEVIARQLSTDPVPIPSALRGHPLGAVLAQATAKSLLRRFRTAREAYDALERCDVTDVAWPITDEDDDVPTANAQATRETVGAGHRRRPDPNQPTVEVARGDEARDPPQRGHARWGSATTRALAGRPSTDAIRGAGLAAPPATQPSPGAPARTGHGTAQHGAGTRQGPTQQGERRQLTLLACKPAGVEQIAETLDPEAFHALVRTYQALFAEVIEAHGGEVGPQRGEELVAYFGHPAAREDDAVRALEAALDLSERVPRLAERAGLPAAPPVLVGVHTGLVVISDEGAPSLVGATVKVARRLADHAAPGAVLASRSTQRLVEGFFRLEAVPEIAPGGGFGAVEPFVVRARTAARDRLDARGLTPLVGRDPELATLGARWAQAASGAGQVALLAGEAGMGKSRLVRAFRDKLADAPPRWLEARCSPQLENSAFHPFVELLRDMIGAAPDRVGRGGAPSATYEGERTPVVAEGGPLARLELLLADTGAGPLAPTMLAALLALPTGKSMPPIAPQRQRQETLAALVCVFLGLAEREPLVLVVEDLHWADPSTLELLGLLVEEARPSPLFLLLTARPTFVAPWPMRSHVVQVELGPLAPGYVEQLVERLAGARAARPDGDDDGPRHGALPEAVVRALAERSDGVPLFAEELTKMVLESAAAAGGADRPSWLGALEIPTTLHDSLMARLDRLGPAKQVAQLAAVVGRSFGYEVLEQAACGPEPLLFGADPESLRRALAQLADAELVFQRGRPPRATYTFKHALVQDAAYQSLLKTTRQAYHARIATVLAERFPDAPPELLARHYTEAALVPAAVAAWQRAGEAALVASALAEAQSHLRRGLELLRELPESAERVRDEITLQTTLGVVLMITRGFAAPEVEATYARAHALCREVGSSPQLFPALWGLWIYFHVRGDYARAEQHGEQLLALADATGESGIRLGALQALGATRFLRGRPAEARELFGQALAIYDPGQHLTLAFLFGQDAAVFSLSHLAWIAFHLGEPERARAHMAEALAVCAELEQPTSRGFAEHFAATLACLLGDLDDAEVRARALAELSAEVGMPHWEALARIDLGWAAAMRGARAGGGPDRALAAEGAAMIRRGLDMLLAVGSRVSFTCWRASLVEAEITCGHLDEAEALLGDTLAFAEAHDERYYEPELHRLAGEIALARGGPDARARAEAALRRGLVIADAQRAFGLSGRIAERLDEIGAAGAGA